MSLVRKENGLIYAEPEFREIYIADKNYFDKKVIYEDLMMLLLL